MWDEACLVAAGRVGVQAPCVVCIDAVAVGRRGGTLLPSRADTRLLAPSSLIVPRPGGGPSYSLSRADVWLCTGHGARMIVFRNLQNPAYDLRVTCNTVWLPSIIYF